MLYSKSCEIRPEGHPGGIRGRALTAVPAWIVRLGRLAIQPQGDRSTPSDL